MPAYDRETPSHRWPLSEEGRAASAELDLPAGSYLVASEEPKAWQTLKSAGPVTRDARFGEVRRSGEPWDGPFRERRRAYVEGADHPGWEPRADVAARFDEAVEHHRVLAKGRTLVIGSHGIALTVWLTARIGMTGAGDFWAGLRFPDVIAVDLAAGRVHRYRE